MPTPDLRLRAPRLRPNTSGTWRAVYIDDSVSAFLTAWLASRVSSLAKTLATWEWWGGYVRCISSNASCMDRRRYHPNFYDYRVKKVTCSGACYDYDYRNFGEWLMRADVREALGICGDAGNDAFDNNAGGCISMGLFDSGVSTSTFTADVGRALDANIPVMMYFGKCDLACDYIGGIAMASDLPWRGRDGFQAAELHELTIAGAAAAQIKTHGGLTWLQIDSAGHMVPADQPAAAFFAIRHLLANGSTLGTASACPTPSVVECPVCPTAAVCTTVPATNAVPTSSADTAQCPPSQECPTCSPPPQCPQCTTLPPLTVAADDENPIRCSTVQLDGVVSARAPSSSMVGLAAALGVALFVVSAVLLFVLLTGKCAGGKGDRQYRATKSRAFSTKQTNPLYKNVLASSDDEDF